MENETNSYVLDYNQAQSISDNESAIRYRITYISGIVLVLIALVTDILELLGTYFSFVILGVVASVFGAVVIGTVFKILEVDYTSNTRVFISSFIMFAGELIPGLDAFPAYFLWTAGVIVICTLVRMEDRGQKPTLVGALGRIATFATGPLGIITRYPIQKRKDVEFQTKRTDLIRRRNQEIAANPDKEEFIRKKYQGLMSESQEASMSPLERRVDKIAQIDKGGVKFAGNSNMLDLKSAVKNSQNIAQKLPQNPGTKGVGPSTPKRNG